MRVEVSGDLPEGDDGAAVAALEAGLNDYMVAVSRDIEKRGYAELDCRASAECVDDAIRGNVYTFDEAGNRLEV